MILIQDSADFSLAEIVKMDIFLIQRNRNVIIVSSNFQVVAQVVIQIIVTNAPMGFSYEMVTVKRVMVFIARIVHYVMQRNAHNVGKVLLFF